MRSERSRGTALWIISIAVVVVSGASRPTDGRESPGVEDNSHAVSECLERLRAAVDQAYADVGITAEDVKLLYETQAPPQKLMGSWKAYQKSWPAIVKAREAAAMELAALGPGAVPALLRVADKSDERRGGDILVSALVKMGKPAVPVLIDGLSDEDALVRARAAVSLGQIRDIRSTEPLIRALEDPDRRVLSAAVRSLGLLKDRRAVGPLLDHWNRDLVRRSDLAWALGQIGDRRATTPIMAALEECIAQAQKTDNWDMNSWDMRVYAGALGQIGDLRAVPLLKKMLHAGPQMTKASTRQYHVAETAAMALRSLGLKVTGDMEKGEYRVVETALQVEAQKPQTAEVLDSDDFESESVPLRKDYAAAVNTPQPIELWKAKQYGCGGNPRTEQKLRTDTKKQYPVLLTWPLIRGASKYVVQTRGIRGSRPSASFESATNNLQLRKSDIGHGRYQWTVSAYDSRGRFMGDIETIDPAEVFAIGDPEPVRANGTKVLIDLNHSAGHVRGWGYYNHAQYMTKELLENAGFEVEVNERDLLTPETLKDVDLLICNYYWTGWPGFRSYLKSEISAVRDFVDGGGSLLLVGCDRSDGGNDMSAAGNELAAGFGLKFSLDEITGQDGTALPDTDQDIISFRKPVQVQLPVAVQGKTAITLLRFGGVSIAKADRFGDGKVIVAGTGMSFLDCYLGDFQRAQPLHVIMFYDMIRYLTGVDWRRSCKQEFVDKVLFRRSQDTGLYRVKAN